METFYLLRVSSRHRIDTTDRRAVPSAASMIDMHLHALATDPEPTGICTGIIPAFPVMEPGRPWAETVMARLKKPPCADPIFIEPGFGKRVMFGSDQMVWPETIEVAIQSIEQATFLTPEQKRDIFYNNAARFLRLSEAEIASHTGR